MLLYIPGSSRPGRSSFVVHLSPNRSQLELTMASQSDPGLVSAYETMQVKLIHHDILPTLTGHHRFAENRAACAMTGMSYAKIQLHGEM